MIRTAGRVQAKIIPIAEVARLPGWHAGCGAVGCCLPGGAGEGGLVESVPDGIGVGDVGGVGADAVVACFVGVAGYQVWLFVAGGLVMSCFFVLGDDLIGRSGTDYAGEVPGG